MENPTSPTSLSASCALPRPYIAGYLSMAVGDTANGKGQEALGCSTLTGARPSLLGTLFHWQHLHRNARHHEPGSLAAWAHWRPQATSKSLLLPSVAGRRPGHQLAAEATFREQRDTDGIWLAATLRAQAHSASAN